MITENPTTSPWQGTLWNRLKRIAVKQLFAENNPMKTRKKDIKLAMSTAGIVKKIRREMPPVSKPFVDKRKLNKLDLVGRKAKHKTKDL